MLSQNTYTRFSKEDAKNHEQIGHHCNCPLLHRRVLAIDLTLYIYIEQNSTKNHKTIWFSCCSVNAAYTIWSSCCAFSSREFSEIPGDTSQKHSDRKFINWLKKRL
uniref:Uncharacterized protein isoform X2 n=1 Tax=Nicotiana tabacum TaxID=4097 RepID=A0A1S3YW88_TOBAC|nr:PREDICTED: uncharacterized protein LOC107780271 isoform X2 [Nicotiana tabacum]